MGINIVVKVVPSIRSGVMDQPTKTTPSIRKYDLTFSHGSLSQTLDSLVNLMEIRA